MKYNLRYLVLMSLCAIFMGALSTAVIAATGEVAVSPAVQNAINATYLNAKEANMIYPEQGADNTAMLQKRTRDPISQMIAVGIGVAAGVLAINFLSGGMGTASRFYTTTSAMFGGMLGDHVYRKYYAPPVPSVPSRVKRRISP